MHFLSSVIRLGVLQDGAEREFWGTGFLVNQNRLVTAHHCLPKASTVTIDGWIPDEAPLASIKTFGTIDPVRPAFLTRSRVDLAILQFQADPFPAKTKVDSAPRAAARPLVSHLTSVWNWALRKIEQDSQDGIYYTRLGFVNLLNGHGAKTGLPQDAIYGTLGTVHLAWQRCFKKLARKPRLKGR